MNLIANASGITPENTQNTQHQAEDHINVANSSKIISIMKEQEQEIF